MAPKDEAPDNGITYDDEGQPQGSAGDLARYHALRGEYGPAIVALADKADPHTEKRASARGE